MFDLSGNSLKILKQFRRGMKGNTNLQGDVGYTCHSITPTMHKNAEMLLGREDGIVERWCISQEGGGNIKIAYDGELPLLGNQMGTNSHRPIEVPANTPITYLYNRGRRMVVCTKFNRIVIDDTPKVPMFYFKEAPETLVAQVDICGDLMCTLQNNGVFRMAPFISTISPIQGKLPSEFLASDYMEPGGQRIVAYPDLVVVLGKMGQLLFMTHAVIPGARPAPTGRT